MIEEILEACMWSHDPLLIYKGNESMPLCDIYLPSINVVIQPSFNSYETYTASIASIFS